MPRTPVDYSKTLIYKLIKNDDYANVNVYVGSTTDFTRRKTEHKNTCNNENRKGYTDKKYQFIRENGGWSEWNMVEIEKHNCNDGNEARAREEYWRWLCARSWLSGNLGKTALRLIEIFRMYFDTSLKTSRRD